MKQRFYIILTVLLLTGANSLSAIEHGVMHDKDKAPQQEDVYVVKREEFPKTRSLIQTVEVWNYGTHLEVICNENLGVVTCTLSVTPGSIISSETFTSDMLSTARITLPPTQGAYLLNIVSSSGYEGYAIIVG